MGRYGTQESARNARRRLKRVDPGNVAKIISKDIYWAVPFLRLFLEHCDDLAFEDPVAAHRMAVHAPHLAHLIRVSPSPDDYPDRAAKRSHRVLALGVFGSACMRLDRAKEAGRQYLQAFDLCKGGVTEEARASLHARFGKLQSVLRQPDASWHFERSLDLYRRTEDSPGEAQVLVLKAGLYWYEGDRRSAMLDLAASIQAAAKNPGDSRSTRAMTAAFGNLARILAEDETGTLESSDALHLIKLAKRELAGKSSGLTRKTPKSWIKANLLWVEALLYRRLHFTRQALRLFRLARSSFAKLEQPGRFLMVSIELGLTYLEQGDGESFLALRKDTLKKLSALAEDPQVVELIGSWVGNRDSCLETKQAAAAVFWQDLRSTI